MLRTVDAGKSKKVERSEAKRDCFRQRGETNELSQSRGDGILDFQIKIRR